MIATGSGGQRAPGMLTLQRARAHAVVVILTFAAVYAVGVLGRSGLVDRFGHVIGGDLLTLAAVRLEHDVGVRDPQRRVFAKPAERALRRFPQEARPLVEDLGWTRPLLRREGLEQRFASSRRRSDRRHEERAS